MSKYVSKRLEKIEKLVEKLNTINIKIQDYINLLEEIKKEHNMFNIRISFQIISDINEDPNIQCFDNLFYIAFIDNHVHYWYDIYLKQRKDLLPTNFQHFLRIIDTKINLDDLNNCIISSNELYSEIKSIYQQIKLKYGTFAINSNKLISHLKNISEDQIIDNDSKYYYIYFKMLKDNKLELINFEYKNEQNSGYLYQIKFPLIENIKNIYNQRNLNNIYNKDLYIEIFKEEFIRLNKYFCDIFIIDKESIDFDFYFQLIDFDINYSQTYTYHLGINPFNNKKIELIIDKINLEKQFDNF